MEIRGFEAALFVDIAPIGQMGLELRWFPLGNGGVFNHDKDAIWQSHLTAEKEGVVNTIIFSNHKTYQVRLIKVPTQGCVIRENNISAPMMNPIKDTLNPLRTNLMPIGLLNGVILPF